MILSLGHSLDNALTTKQGSGLQHTYSPLGSMHVQEASYSWSKSEYDNDYKNRLG